MPKYLAPDHAPPMEDPSKPVYAPPTPSMNAYNTPPSNSPQVSTGRPHECIISSSLFSTVSVQMVPKPMAPPPPPPSYPPSSMSAPPPMSVPQPPPQPYPGEMGYPPAPPPPQEMGGPPSHYAQVGGNIMCCYALFCVCVHLTLINIFK